MHCYVVNQLRVEGEYRDEFIVTKASEDAFEVARELGIAIEQRGSKSANFVWMGQISVEKELLEPSFRRWRSVEIEQVFGRKFGR